MSREISHPLLSGPACGNIIYTFYIYIRTITWKLIFMPFFLLAKVSPTSTLSSICPLTSVTLALRMLRQEDHLEFRISSGYIVRPCLQKWKSKANKQG